MYRKKHILAVRYLWLSFLIFFLTNLLKSRLNEMESVKVDASYFQIDFTLLKEFQRFLVYFI